MAKREPCVQRSGRSSEDGTKRRVYRRVRPNSETRAGGPVVGPDEPYSGVVRAPYRTVIGLPVTSPLYSAIRREEAGRGRLYARISRKETQTTGDASLRARIIGQPEANPRCAARPGRSAMAWMPAHFRKHSRWQIKDRVITRKSPQMMAPNWLRTNGGGLDGTQVEIVPGFQRGVSDCKSKAIHGSG